MGTKKYECSFDNKYYVKECCQLNTYASYINQIKEVLNCNPKSVLEIGSGNKLFYHQIMLSGIKIKNVDINNNLNPDYVMNVSKLKFHDNSFDVVCGFEVLEHLPFNDFLLSINEMKRVSKKYVIISLPITQVGISFTIKAPLLNNFYVYIDMGYYLSNYILNVTNQKMCDGHFWEINRKGFKLKDVSYLIRRNFNVIKEYRAKFNPNHYFIIIKK